MNSELESVNLPADLLAAARDVARSGAAGNVAALIPRGHELGLDVLLGLPGTVVDPLDTVPTRAAGAVLEQSGEPRGDLVAAHVVHCAQRRDWPVVTGAPEPLLSLDSSVESKNLA